MRLSVLMIISVFFFFFFFFNDTATTEIYTLSLHDALPICAPAPPRRNTHTQGLGRCGRAQQSRSNSSTDQGGGKRRTDMRARARTVLTVCFPCASQCDFLGSKSGLKPLISLAHPDTRPHNPRKQTADNAGTPVHSAGTSTQ